MGRGEIGSRLNRESDDRVRVCGSDDVLPRCGFLGRRLVLVVLAMYGQDG